MRISDWSSDVCSSDLTQNLNGMRRSGLAARLACPGRRPANGTYEIALRIVGMRHETALAARAMRQLHHIAIKKSNQHPSPGKAEHRPFFAIVRHAGDR